MTKKMKEALNHIKLSIDVDKWAIDEVERAFDLIDDNKKDQTGYWQRVESKRHLWSEWWYECSKCHMKPLYDEWGIEKFSAWCPHCGVLMVGLIEENMVGLIEENKER